MAWDTLALTVLHLLIFAYWLGGDLGAFYSSFLLTDAKNDPAARIAAARVVNTVDLAPRFSLIFAAPTGLGLAVSKGWLPGVDVLWVVAAFGVALVWAIAALFAHLRHGAGPWPHVDRVVRFGALAGLVGAGGAGLAGLVEIPLFLALKLLVLALAIALGLAIRQALKPFGPAFASLMKDGPSADGDAAIAASLTRVRPLVILIWASLITAAALGVATPV